MEEKDIVKKEKFKYDWQDYLVNNLTKISKLKKFNKNYYYKNKIQEEELEQWCFKAVWIGRSQGNYKCHPEFLFDDLDKLLNNQNSEINEFMEKVIDEVPSPSSMHTPTDTLPNSGI